MAARSSSSLSKKKTTKTTERKAETGIACKDTCSALQILLPDDFAAELDEIRAAHDRSYHHWPPHVNVVWPFVGQKSLPSDCFARLAAYLRDQVGVFALHFGPASVKLWQSDAKKNVPASRVYVVLEPLAVVPRADSFERLQQGVEAELHLRDVRRMSTPHITIAQLSRADADARLPAWRDRLFGQRDQLVITVDQLCWVTRSDDRRGRTIHVFPLQAA